MKYCHIPQEFIKNSVSLRGFLIFLILLVAAGSAFTLDLELSGEVKTGLYAERMEKDGQINSYTRIYNNDGDSGLAEGRVRLRINITQGNFGMRTRFFQQNFNRGIISTNNQEIKKDIKDSMGLDFAYAYGNLLNDQFTISAGFLGESPWGTGGPDLFREVEYTDAESPIMGIRTEWKPNFLPGLNLGFVLNREDDTVPSEAKQQFGDLFLESVVGIAYEHDYFAFRFAYRFDRGLDSPAAIVNGERFVYRVEERILGKLLPGMQVWANGYCYGINAEGKGSGYGQMPAWMQNWLYVSYDSAYFTAGLNVGYYDVFGKNSNIQRLEFKPSFYWNFFDNFLVAGMMGGMGIGFNDGKAFKDAFYNFWFIEPQVRANFSSNVYVAIVYRYISSPQNSSGNTDTTNWVNLRLVYTF